jgi:hypothetical protein
MNQKAGRRLPWQTFYPIAPAITRSPSLDALVPAPAASTHYRLATSVAFWSELASVTSTRSISKQLWIWNIYSVIVFASDPHTYSGFGARDVIKDHKVLLITSYIDPSYIFIFPLPLNSSFPCGSFYYLRSIPTRPHDFCMFVIVRTMLVSSPDPFGWNPTVGPASKDYGEWNPAGMIQQRTRYPHYSPMFHWRWESDSHLARQSLAKTIETFQRNQKAG